MTFSQIIIPLNGITSDHIIIGHHKLAQSLIFTRIWNHTHHINNIIIIIIIIIIIFCILKLQMDPCKYGIILLISIVNVIIVIEQHLYTISTMDVLDPGAQSTLENCLLPIVVPIASTSIPIFLGPWIATDWNFWTSWFQYTYSMA